MQLVWDDCLSNCQRPHIFWSSNEYLFIVKAKILVHIKWPDRSSSPHFLSYVDIELRMVSIFRTRNPISYKYMSFWCSFLHPHLTTMFGHALIPCSHKYHQLAYTKWDGFHLDWSSLSCGRMQHITSSKGIVSRTKILACSSKFWRDMNFPYQEGLLLYQVATIGPILGMV